MLKIKNLKAGYNNFSAIKGVNMEVNSSEIVSIIGPNGAGKSTVLKSIYNISEIYSGEITFNGKNLTDLSTSGLIKNGIGYVKQGSSVFPSLTVKENFDIGGFLFEDKKKLEIEISNILKETPFLKNKANEKAYLLSGGQQQLLALTMALIMEPKLLLLDEPSMGLDPNTMIEIFDKILEVNKKGVAVFMVEQNVKQAMRISHKIYVMENGQIVFGGRHPRELDKKLKEVYFGV